MKEDFTGRIVSEVPDLTNIQDDDAVQGNLEDTYPGCSGFEEISA